MASGGPADAKPVKDLSQAPSAQGGVAALGEGHDMQEGISSKLSGEVVQY